MSPAPSQLIQDLDAMANPRFDITTSISPAAADYVACWGADQLALELGNASKAASVRHSLVVHFACFVGCMFTLIRTSITHCQSRRCTMVLGEP
jgi:hypothetical protein